jgi:hypothetical protein
MNYMRRLKRNERTDDGWFVALVLETFAYLVSEYSFEITRVQDHFRGPHVWYVNTAYQLSVQYDPEAAEPSIEVFVRKELVPGSHARVVTAAALLRARQPSVAWDPDVAIGDPVHRTRSTLTMWADGLRRFGPDLLKGEPLIDAPWTYAW